MQDWNLIRPDNEADTFFLGRQEMGFILSNMDLSCVPRERLTFVILQ